MKKDNVFFYRWIYMHMQLITNACENLHARQGGCTLLVDNMIYIGIICVADLDEVEHLKLINDHFLNLLKQ